MQKHSHLIAPKRYHTSERISNASDPPARWKIIQAAIKALLIVFKKPPSSGIIALPFFKDSFL